MFTDFMTGRQGLSDSYTKYPSDHHGLWTARPYQYLVDHRFQCHDLALSNWSVRILPASHLAHGHPTNAQEGRPIWSFSVGTVGLNNQPHIDRLHGGTHSLHGLASISAGYSAKHELCGCGIWCSTSMYYGDVDLSWAKSF